MKDYPEAGDKSSYRVTYTEQYPLVEGHPPLFTSQFYLIHYHFLILANFEVKSAPGTTGTNTKRANAHHN